MYGGDAGLGLVLFEWRAHTISGEAGASTSKLEAAHKTGSLLFIGVIGAIVFLVYLRLHGTAMLERRTQSWRDAGWRAKVGGILMGFARGVQTIRTWRELALAVLSRRSTGPVSRFLRLDFAQSRRPAERDRFRRRAPDSRVHARRLGDSFPGVGGG